MHQLAGPRVRTGETGTTLAAAGGDPALAAIEAFREELQRQGVSAGPDQLARFGRALASVDLARRELVYWAGFAALCTQREHLPPYTRAFERFWLAPESAGRERARSRLSYAAAGLPGAEEAVERDERGRGFKFARYSALELDREKNFADYSPDEFTRFLAAVDALRMNPPLRRSRRAAATRRGRIDVRRILRDAMKFAGEPIEPSFRRPALKRRRVVALCDVSGSMQNDTRALLAFFHAGVAAGGFFEAFSLGTRTVRLTRALARPGAAAALSAAAALARDWGGGTRLGTTLRQFLDGWGQRGLARGAVMVIVSDGWERGDVVLLAAQMKRLRRLAHRIVWVNPRKAAQGYEPLAAGMAAALPFVDTFVSGHNLNALDELVRTIFET